MNRRDFVFTAAAGITASSLPSTILTAAPRPAVDRRLLQALLDDVAKELGVVGAQMALFDGEQLYEFATGLANVERKIAVTRDTLFQIGSTTKLFNAALVMALVDDGVLDLDAPVKTWIEDFKLADPEAAEQISLRQLLSMSAGIDNGSYQDYGRGDDALELYVAALAEVPMIFAPGAAFGYSNAGTNIAGLAAQRAAGKNWETLLAQKILQPLSLEHSANFPEELLYHSVSLGYHYESPGGKPLRVPSWGLPRSLAPAGSTLCCSAGDLVRFARMCLFGGKAADGRQVVSKRNIETMHTPQVTMPARIMAEQWCTGPNRKEWDGKAIYGHSGTNSGGSSTLLWCPESNIAIATNSNVARQGYPFADRICNSIFPEVFGIRKPASLRPEDVTPVPVDLSAFVGRFEALGIRFEFTVESEKLVARVYQVVGERQSGEPVMTSILIPLGDKRFFPVAPEMSGNRGWDVAFWGDDSSGRATHYLNGVFAMRRTG